MYARKLMPLMIEMLSEFRILYLTGPRQSGKTTLAQSISQQIGMDYITLDNPAVRASVNNDPHGFIGSLRGKKVILDEFQYAPDLIPAIKEASDALPPGYKGKFLLTGSADIFRSAQTQEALPGHMARLELYPLAITEMKNTAFNIVDYLRNGNFQRSSTPFIRRQDLARLILDGGYPEVQSKSPRAKQLWFKSYLSGRLFKDFETLYTARGDYRSKLQALAPFLAGLTGNLLKYANIANDLQLDDKLVKSYIEILELMFIIRRVPAYLKNFAKRQASQMPKLQFIDTGLACHLLGLRHEEQVLSSQYYGGLLESLIYMECCKHATWAEEEVALYHFRDKQKNEVDIVMEHSGGKIIGIEIKASASIRIQDFKGLAKLAEFAGKQFDRGVLFYSGQEILPFHNGKLVFHALPLGLLMQ